MAEALKSALFIQFRLKFNIEETMLSNLAAYSAMIFIMFLKDINAKNSNSGHAAVDVI